MPVEPPLPPEPEAPEAPEAPAEPEAPEAPVEPEAPEAPAVPALPARPPLPTSEESSSPQATSSEPAIARQVRLPKEVKLSCCMPGAFPIVRRTPAVGLRNVLQFDTRRRETGATALGSGAISGASGRERA